MIGGVIESTPGPAVAEAGAGAGAPRAEAPTRWFPVGCAAGAALVLGTTAWQEAAGGYTLDDLPSLLAWNSAYAVYPAVGAGFADLVRARRRWSRGGGRLRLRTRSLMLIVACAAFLVGPVLSSYRMTAASTRSYFKARENESLAGVFRVATRRFEGDADLTRRNADGLRAGAIPEGLLPIQRDFLRTLDAPGVDAGHRRARRDLITAGEDRRREISERGVGYSKRLVAYFEGLEAKYERARRRPWLPVAPDPPRPVH